MRAGLVGSKHFKLISVNGMKYVKRKFSLSVNGMKYVKRKFSLLKAFFDYWHSDLLA